MEHLDAVQLGAVDKYLLGELTPDLRDQFEEHYFGCVECAADLRATATFLEVAKSELRSQPAPKPVPGNGAKTRRLFLWTPAFLAPALAASLMVIAYQNIVVLPKAESEVAELRSPAVLPNISLVGSNSRGGETAAIDVKNSRMFSISFDIPAEDRYASYTCEFLSPSDAVAWRLDVSPQQAKDTVNLRVPGVSGAAGVYTLVVRGNADSSHAMDGKELIRYHLAVQN